MKLRKTITCTNLDATASAAELQFQHAQNTSIPTTDEIQAQENEDSLISMISLFHKNIKCGPEYICTCCDQLWYKSSVVKCDANKYKACSQDVVNSLSLG